MRRKFFAGSYRFSFYYATTEPVNTVDWTKFTTIDLAFAEDAECWVGHYASYPPLPTTTTTTVPLVLFMLPDVDVGSGTLVPFGAGTGRWDRLNSGIDSGTPNDTNGMWGLDDQYRLGFTSPSFPGTCSSIIVRYRAQNPLGSDGVNVTLYSDGASSDGSSGLETPGGSYANYQHTFSVAKTAAQLTNLEVLVKSWSGANDDYFSEVEVEIVL